MASLPEKNIIKNDKKSVATSESSAFNGSVARWELNPNLDAKFDFERFKQEIMNPQAKRFEKDGYGDGRIQFSSDLLQEIHSFPAWLKENFAMILELLVQKQEYGNFAYLIKKFKQKFGPKAFIEFLRKQSDKFYTTCREYLIWTALKKFSPHYPNFLFWEYLLNERNLSANYRFELSDLKKSSIPQRLIEQVHHENYGYLDLDKTLKLFFDHGSDIQYCDETGKDALLSATQYSKGSIQLLKCGANPLLNRTITIELNGKKRSVQTTALGAAMRTWNVAGWNHFEPGSAFEQITCLFEFGAGLGKKEFRKLQDIHWYKAETVTSSPDIEYWQNFAGDCIKRGDYFGQPGETETCKLLEKDCKLFAEKMMSSDIILLGRCAPKQTSASWIKHEFVWFHASSSELARILKRNDIYFPNIHQMYRNVISAKKEVEPIVRALFVRHILEDAFSPAATFLSQEKASVIFSEYVWPEFENETEALLTEREGVKSHFGQK